MKREYINQENLRFARRMQLKSLFRERGELFIGVLSRPLTTELNLLVAEGKMSETKFGYYKFT